jgi:hypothetical protein
LWSWQGLSTLSFLKIKQYGQSALLQIDRIGIFSIFEIFSCKIYHLTFITHPKNHEKYTISTKLSTMTHVSH